MGCEESEIAASGDFSLPSLPESSFRELDDAFLQTQTRIWLGEVLQIRLDEKLVLSELLADGELLFQVSKLVWKLLLARNMELRHIKPYKNKPFASKKNSGRYRPYSNVDSFLKICKIVGLTGIDLFSPSDVVERRNTRRVCMGIRSFSKKSRSQNINVPDFDVVTYTVVMAKDMVGCIRRNLELSHGSIADSSNYYLQKHAGGKSRKGFSVTGIRCLSRDALSFGNQFDVDNNFQNIESFKLHNDKIDQWNKIKQEYKSQAITKYDYEEMASGITSNARNSYFVKELEETEHSLYAPDSCLCKTSCSDRDVSDSNDISLTLLKKFVAYEDEESQIDLKGLDNAGFVQSEELLSRHSYSLPAFCKWDQKGKFAVTSKGSKDYKISTCFLEEGIHAETIPCIQHKASEVLTSKVVLSCVPNDDDNVVVRAAVVILDADGKELNNYRQALSSNVRGIDFHENCPAIGDDANDFCDRGVVTAQDIGDGGKRVLDVITNDVVPANSDENVSHSGSCLTNECNDGNRACQYDKVPVHHSEHSSKVHDQEEIKPEHDTLLSVDNLVETEEGRIEIPQGKPQKKLLIKSVLVGTAAFGLIFIFFHVRRNGGEKAAKSNKASSHISKERIQKYSPQKVRRSRTEVVYPAEKLKLK